ncbi:hypothetical protein [Streptomyces sp. NPDC101776]|uniref:hypothetical protein n=1 Tax=Streptomyces sp. NPDC101776 TaxID=3366146 RepID=UPI003820A6E0
MSQLPESSGPHGPSTSSSASTPTIGPKAARRVAVARAIGITVRTATALAVLAALAVAAMLLTPRTAPAATALQETP